MGAGSYLSEYRMDKYLDEGTFRIVFKASSRGWIFQNEYAHKLSDVDVLGSNDIEILERSMECKYIVGLRACWEEYHSRLKRYWKHLCRERDKKREKPLEKLAIPVFELCDGELNHTHQYRCP